MDGTGLQTFQVRAETGDGVLVQHCVTYYAISLNFRKITAVLGSSVLLKGVMFEFSL